MKANRLVLLALAGAAAFSLSGCESGNHAAEVNGTVISTSDVDFLTRVNCAAATAAGKDPAQSGQVQVLPLRLMRAQMVNALVQGQLNEQLAERSGAAYDKATLRQVMQQFETAVQAVPKKDQERFRDMVEGLYRGQMQVLELVKAKLAASGVEATDQQLSDAASAEQDAFRKSADIDINPVYGADANGNAGAIDPSLSRAVSDFAEQAANPTPAAEWVTGLPRKLRCG